MINCNIVPFFFLFPSLKQNIIENINEVLFKKNKKKEEEINKRKRLSNTARIAYKYFEIIINEIILIYALRSDKAHNEKEHRKIYFFFFYERTLISSRISFRQYC